MRYIKRFNQIDSIDESLKTVFLIPLMCTLGYCNAQNIESKEIFNKAKEIVADKTELTNKDLTNLVNNKAALVYNFMQMADTDIKRKDFIEFCNTNNINKNFFDKFLDTTKGSFVTNITAFGNLFQANLNLTKNIALFGSKDTFNKNLGVKIKF